MEPHTRALWPSWFFQRCIQGAKSDLKGREQARSWLHKGAVEAMPGTGAAAGHHSLGRGKPSRQAPKPGLCLAAPNSRSCCSFTDLCLQTLRAEALCPGTSRQLCFTLSDLKQPAWKARAGGKTLLGDQGRACGRKALKGKQKSSMWQGSSLRTGKVFLVRACLDWSNPHCVSTSTPRKPGACGACCSWPGQIRLH